MKKVILPSILSISMSLAMSACKTNAQYNAGVEAAKKDGYSSGQADAQANAVKAGNLVIELQKEYGGMTNFELVKFGKDDANYAVIKANSTYVGVDISHYSAGTLWSAYAPTASIFLNLTSNGNGTYSCGAGCVQLGNGPATTSMVFEKTTESMKDLDKTAALVESYNVEMMASNLSSEFGLSEERSIKVAKLASSWEKLSKTRALTNADAESFSQELAGVSIADMENAEKDLQNGSMSKLNDVLSRAATVNGTTSENMSMIMMKLFF
jgi:hypothetical protein